MGNVQMYNRRSKGTIPYWVHWALATGMLLASGVLYRHLEPKWRGTGTGDIRLPVPLNEFPKTIHSWEGQKIPIRDTTVTYMERNFANDYLNNRYDDPQRQAWADLYVVYCSSRPANILGHRPRVCYRGAGWIHDATEESEVTTRTGRKLSCLIHRFHQSEPDYIERVVLSFYVVNGTIAVNEKSFSSLGRTPNISGDPARYVAQVQVSSTLESYVRIAGVDLIDTVLEHLPGPDGRVAAAPDYDPNRPPIDGGDSQGDGSQSQKTSH